MRIISPLTPRSPRKFAHLFITIQQLIEISQKNDPTLAPHPSNCWIACASIAFSVNFQCVSSERMNNTTKFILKHSKLQASLFVHSSSLQNSGDPLPKLKWKFSGAPKCEARLPGSHCCLFVLFLSSCTLAKSLCMKMCLCVQLLLFTRGPQFHA